MTEFQEHLRSIAYRMGLTYEEYMRLLFPLVEYDPAGKIPVLPPGIKINFREWDDFGHLPISTMADWEPGAPVSVAVRESIAPYPTLAFIKSTALTRWGGALNPDMHNLKRVMETPPDFFGKPLGVAYDEALMGSVGQAFSGRRHYEKSWRHATWKGSGFVRAADVTRSMAKLTEAIRRRLNAAAIAHLIVAPSIDPTDYDPPTIAQALDSWCELQNRYNREPELLTAPPVDREQYWATMALIMYEQDDGSYIL